MENTGPPSTTSVSALNLKVHTFLLQLLQLDQPINNDTDGEKIIEPEWSIDDTV